MLTDKIKMIGALALVLLLAFVGYEWLQEHDARLKAESVQATQKLVFAEAQQKIDAANADKAQVAAALARSTADLEAQKKQPIAPAQFVVDLNKLIPNMPAPATVVQTAATATTPATETVQIPAADLQAIKAYKLECDETGARLNACQLSTAADAERFDAQATQLKATETERDTWKATAKGGTFWHRALTAGKWIVIGGAVGYLAGKH